VFPEVPGGLSSIPCEAHLNILLCQYIRRAGSCLPNWGQRSGAGPLQVASSVTTSMRCVGHGLNVVIAKRLYYRGHNAGAAASGLSSAT
jgi:hypothetical protein